MEARDTGGIDTEAEGIYCALERICCIIFYFYFLFFIFFYFSLT